MVHWARCKPRILADTSWWRNSSTNHFQHTIRAVLLSGHSIRNHICQKADESTFWQLGRSWNRHQWHSWLFLPKHKLELMFSSIEPYAPRRRYLPGNLFPTLRTTNTYSYHPLFIPANEKIACTCSQTASQSALRSLSCLRSRSQLIFTCNSVKLLDSSVYFPTHPPHSSLISTVASLR